MSDISPPLDYLLSCSQSSLESLELSRLNLAANLRKQARQILDQCIQSEVEARMARWILESRRMQGSDVPAYEPQTLETKPSGTRSCLPAPVQPALPVAKNANSGTLPLPGFSAPSRPPETHQATKCHDAKVSIAAAARAVGALGDARVETRKISRSTACETLPRRKEREAVPSASEFERAGKQCFAEGTVPAGPTPSEFAVGRYARQIPALSSQGLERLASKRPSKARAALKQFGNGNLAGVSVLSSERTIVLIRSLRMASFAQSYLSTSRRAARYAIA